MSRIKELQCELAEANRRVQDLTIEVRTLRTLERRQENALAKYEGTHAQLPQVIRSYGDDLRVLQTRLRNDKVAYRALENKHRELGAELSTLQKQHKHLLDLTKNKQLAEREKLSNLLEEAENKIKHLEKKNQNLMKKIDLLNKNHRDQIAVELGKIKQLQVELGRVKEINNKLETKMEKLRYQSYGGRRSYVWGTGQSLLTPSGIASATPCGPQFTPLTTVVILPTVQSKSRSGGDRLMPRSDSDKKSLKSESVHAESEISDHTKDLQKNLMRQIHEDVINKPNMLVKSNTGTPDSSGDNTTCLDNGISELIKEKDSSDGCDENVAEQIDPVVAVNPYSLPATHGLDNMEKQQLLADPNEKDKVLVEGDKTSVSKPDDDVSSLSSAGGSD